MSTAALNIEKEKTLVPQLRFPEFNGEWELKKMEDLFEFKNGLNKEKEFFGKGTPIINFMDVYKLNSIKKSNIQGLVELSKSEIERYSAIKGDVFFTRTSETIQDIGMSATLIESIENCVFSGFVLRARAKKNEFLPEFTSYLFSIESIRKEITTKSSMTTRALTSGTLLNKVNFSYPKNKTEQQKIASFLSAVDEKIQQLSRKKELLEQYKKGVMQQLFSGKLRFKDENGKDYPDWEEKKLGEVGKIVTGSTPSTAKLEYYNGKHLFVSPADINESRFLMNTKTTLTDLGFEKGRKIKKGSVLFVCIGSTIGKAAIAGDDCITNQQINAIEANSLNSNDFIYSLLELNANNIKLLAGVQAVPLINKTDFSNFSFMFPFIQEQQKIANFLSNIDVKIETTNQQITQTQSFKKGLLQQMFV